MRSDLTNPSRDGYGAGRQRRNVLFLACLGAVCAAAAYVGAVPTRKFGHDLFFLLDNGWRVFNGQRPHLDFTSPWGALSFLVVGAGMALSHGSVNAIGYANALFAFVLSLWGYRLSRDAVSFVPRFFICLYLALLLVSPYPLGWGTVNSSHAMYYNRYGYVLLGLVMIEAFRRTAATEWEEKIGGASTGVVAALLLFLKANYFGVVLLMIGASFLLGRRSKARLSAMTLGFFLTSLAFLTYLDFDAAAFYHDLQLAAGARAMSFSYKELLTKLSGNAVYLLFIVLLSWQSSITMSRQGNDVPGFTYVFLGFFFFALDMVLLCSNQQYTELPLTVLYSLLLVIEVHRRSGNKFRARKKAPFRVERLALVAGATFFFISFFTQFYGLAYGVVQKTWPSDSSSLVRFTEPRLSPLLMYDDKWEPNSNGKRYVEYINSGIRILLAQSRPSDKVLTMDMMNPFPYSMGRSAPRGGMAAATYNYTFSDGHRPSEAWYFGDADIVMVPKRPASPIDGLLKNYRSGLDRRFFLAAESDMWFLYKRR
ncbi:MAG: hypothetical protein FPO08_07000 [Geobacter sp.]|nr:MAG: hypothetical protein FPO08_07000 [Geobacter sp.]